MCGIVAVVGSAVGTTLDEPRLQRALATLHHRGPDGMGVSFDPRRGVALGFARLAILDPEGGVQPMRDADGHVELVWNGELYGFEALRADLERRGHRFRTRGDTEVVLALYREHGEGFLDHLRGEFALVLHDRRAGRVLAARDRFGIRPLFVARTPGGHVFASEAKAMFATGLVTPRLHLADLRDAYRLAWVDSVFEGVSVVPPGGWLGVDTDSGAERAGRYWELELDREDRGAAVRPFEEYRDALREVLDEAIALRLRADVPVGAYLSGGLDSNAVAAAAARHASTPLATYSLGFPSHRRLDETDLARRSARALGVRHTVVPVGTGDLLEAFEEAVWHTEWPSRSLSAASKLLLARRAAQDVKVVLTGEGGDEVFYGYDFHKAALRDPAVQDPAGREGWRGQAAAWRGRWPSLREGWRRRGERLLYRREHRAHLGSTPRGSRACDAVTPDPLPGEPGSLATRVHYGLRGRLPGYILGYFGDRPGMAASVEDRQPLLDHRVFELARRIPAAFKLHRTLSRWVEKHVLREAVRPWVPEDVCDRPKFGYRVPVLPMVRGRDDRLDALVDRWLSPAALEDAGIWAPRTVRGLLALRRRLPDRAWLARRLDRRLFHALSAQVLHGRLVAGQGPS